MRMAFTSGTTGNPKGVTHSFETTLPAADILNGAMSVTEREVFLIYLPLGLNWGTLTLLQPTMPAPPPPLLDPSTARAPLGLIERDRVPFTPTPPPPPTASLNDPDLGRSDLQSLPV